MHSIPPASRAGSCELLPRPDVSGYCPATQEFLRLNHLAAQEFVSAQQQLVRRRFLEEHLFRPSASLCIDGRVQDAPHAIGVPIGVMELYRSAGAKVGPENLMHMQRTRDAILNSHAFCSRNGEQEPRVKMRFQVVHYSQSAFATASCAAWNHDTDAAKNRMMHLADKFNCAWPGSMIALPLMIDTDLDAISVVSERGKFGTRELLDLSGSPEASSLHGLVIDRLLNLFPSDWAPLRSLPVKHRGAFHQELAECLLRNLDFVRKVIASGRMPEMLDHQERLIFMGRHADWVEDHNSVFLIDDTADRSELGSQVEIAMRYVTRNILMDQVKKGGRNWTVPLVYNVPHVAMDLHATCVHVRAVTVDTLIPAIRHAAPKVVEWLLGSHGLPKEYQTGTVLSDLTDLAERVEICMSVSDKGTRQFMPFK